MTEHDEASPDEMPDDEFFASDGDVPPVQRAATIIRPAPDGPTIPDIMIVPEIHTVIDRMTEVLVTDNELYRRGGKLVHVIRADDALPGAVPDTPIIREVPVTLLITRVSRHARCVRYNASIKEWVATVPPTNLVRAVHEQGEWPGVRSLRGIVEAPSMRPDGTVIQTPGYDAATGYLYAPNAEFGPVAEAPSQSDATLAYARLREVFQDFPYVDESHRSAAVAAILTLIARPAIRGSVPLWFFDAASKRSGKSRQLDSILLITSGRPSSRMTYPEVDDELEKVLSSYALRGAAYVPFDNVARPFGGAALDKVVTAMDKVDLRVLGASDLRTVDWTAVIFASGNNATFRGDMLPRVLAPRIESDLENPEERTDFLHPDLLEWVARNRATLAVDALAVLRAYVVAGRPEQPVCRQWGGFEAWARLVPQAIVWAGGVDPMGARRGKEGDLDPESIGAAAMIEGWERMGKLYATPSMTLKQAIGILYPPRPYGGGEIPPDGLEELREAIDMMCDSKPGAPPQTRRLAMVLNKIKGRPVGGKKFKSACAGKGVSKWSVEACR